MKTILCRGIFVGFILSFLIVGRSFALSGIGLPPLPADANPPTVSISSPLGGATVSSTISVSVTNADDVGVTLLELYVDGTIKASTTNPASPAIFSLNTASFTNATHSLTAKAHDAAGNIGTSAAVSVTVSNQTSSDTTPPSTPTGLMVSSTTTSTVSLSWTASTDNVGVAGYKVFQGAAQVGTTASTTFKSGGLNASTTYTYKVSSYDAAGNNSTSSTSVNGTTKGIPVGTDTTLPTVAIVSPTNNEVISSVRIISGASADNLAVSNVQISIDNGAYATATGTTSWTFSLDTTLLVNGNHTIVAKATDTSGNINTTTITVSVANSISGGGGGGGGGGTSGGTGGGTGGGTSGGTGSGSGSTGIPGISDPAAFIQSLLIQLQALIAQLNAQLVISFTRNLTVGSTGQDVKNLQLFLNDNGYQVASQGGGSPGNESTYFGQRTASALAKFQQAHGLPSTGFFGPLTRSVMQGM